jgi:hypothetical protein
MGTLYQFTCAACGYTTEASGGSDRGIREAVQTVSCRTVGRSSMPPWAGRILVAGGPSPSASATPRIASCRGPTAARARSATPRCRRESSTRSGTDPWTP